MKEKSVVAKSIIALLMVALMIGFSPQMTIASKPLQVQLIPKNFTQIAQTARPSVVNIRTVKTIQGGGPVFRHFFKGPFRGKAPVENCFRHMPDANPHRDFKQQSLGSGFIIDRKGYIVTNNHVIENADQIKVRLVDGSEFDAEVIGRDTKTDIALIKIKTSKDLIPLHIGDSDALPVGTWVVAIGSPFGLEQTVTAGIVSAKGRTIGAGPYDDFIQTDASINPGNSGGPLLTLAGEVVGINTAIIANGQGIGFAIPVNLAKGIIKQLKSDGEVTRGWLGIGIQELTPELSEYYKLKDRKGVLVSHVYKGDPADKSGIKPEDIIISVNGENISTVRELSTIIANTPVGKRIPISLFKDGKEKTVYAELTRRRDLNTRAQNKLYSSNTLGLRLDDITPEMANKLGYGEDEKGVIVTHVKPGSKGEVAGIQTGDILKEINHKKINSLSDYKEQIVNIKLGEPVELLIKRGNKGFLAIKIA